MNNHLPEVPGTYALGLTVAMLNTVRVGALGVFEFQPGYYVYLGSAFGPGGLRARIRHHLQISNKPRWHLDYLRVNATPHVAWVVPSPSRIEHEWARSFAANPSFHPATPRFGASDCRCPTHLFYTVDDPAPGLMHRVLRKVQSGARIRRIPLTRPDVEEPLADAR